VVMQSSHATLVLILTALAAQQISYENALALAIGANVGTTITAILGSMSSNIEGRRLAGAHLVFNVVTGLIAIIFINQFIVAVDIISHSTGIGEDDYTLKLAVFHTVFNLVGIGVMIPFINRLVRLLETMLRQRDKTVSEPHFLTDAVLDIPDAAIEALRKEVEHLYGNAFNIIASTLNISPDDIRSSKDLNNLVQATKRIQMTNVDEAYNSHIKPLFNAIVAFVSRAQINADADQLSRFYELREVSRNIAEAIKDIKHLQKNLIRYTLSDNTEIQQEYNVIRMQLANLLRTIEKEKISDEIDREDLTLLSLDEVKVEVERRDILNSGSLDRLIRDNLITPDMATSLINDGAYARGVANNLIEMAHVLFVTADPDMEELEEGITLLQDEIDSILDVD